MFYSFSFQIISIYNKMNNQFNYLFFKIHFLFNLFFFNHSLKNIKKKGINNYT